MADEDSEKELEEPPKRTYSKSRKKHIIREEKDEPAEEPPIPVVSRTGKDKVISPFASENKIEDIDVELEVAATKVTRTRTETKHLLDIIAGITGEGSAAERTAPTT